MPITDSQKLSLLSLKERECHYCNERFFTGKLTAKFCSNPCKQAAYVARLVSKDKLKTESIKAEEPAPVIEQKVNEKKVDHKEALSLDDLKIKGAILDSKLNNLNKK